MWTNYPLDGETTLVRPPRDEDWSSWAKLRTESREFLVPWEPTWSPDSLSRAAFRRRIRRYCNDARDGKGYAFFIFSKKEKSIVGGITLSNIRVGVALSCALGYWMGEPYARKGYMTDAIRTILPFVFDDLKLHRIEAACIPNNLASKRLLQRCGFTEEGLVRQYLRINGIWHDHLLFSLLDSDERSFTTAAP